MLYSLKSERAPRLCVPFACERPAIEENVGNQPGIRGRPGQPTASSVWAMAAGRSPCSYLNQHS
jgi:hypothetical protein